MITSGLQVGRLWTSLADYYIRRGMYETARDVYEEGLTTVVTVRDFSLIFDTLTQASLPDFERASTELDTCAVGCSVQLPHSSSPLAPSAWQLAACSVLCSDPLWSLTTQRQPAGAEIST